MLVQARTQLPGGACPPACRRQDQGSIRLYPRKRAFGGEPLQPGRDKQPPSSRTAPRTARIVRRRLRLPMPIVRILLVLLALASPALAQDGARDAAAANKAAQAFQVYVEEVTKQAGRPDLTRPDVAALLSRVFDLDALNALPPAH